MKNNAALSTFIFIFLAIQLSFADISVSSYSILPQTVRPGITGSISITILNSGSNATSVSAEPSGTSFIISSGKYDLGDFSSGVTTSFTIPFRVAKDTPAGIYNLPIQLNYFSSGSSGFLTGKKTLTVPISIRNPASFQLDASSRTAYSDDDFHVEGMIFNTGGVAYDAKLTVNSSKFYQVGPTPILLGDIVNRTTVSLNLTVASGTSSGKYSIPLVIAYRDIIGTEYSESLYLNADVKIRSPQFMLEIAPDSQINPGKKARIIATLKNTGDMPAYSASIKLLSPDLLTPLSSSEVIAGDFPANSGRQVPFEVGIKSIEPGFYPLSVQVSYKDSKGEVKSPQAISAGINVQALNELSVFVSSKPAPITSGSVHTFSVLVSNIGSSKIKALQVRPVGSPDFKILDAQSAQFIGGLEQDDFSSVQYKILVESVPEGAYPFIVESTFKDAYNAEHKINSTVTLEVVSQETAKKASGQGGDSTICFAGLALLAILVAVYYFKFHKPRGQAPSGNKIRPA